MKIKQFIEKAIEGGWKHNISERNPNMVIAKSLGITEIQYLAKYYKERIFLDPLAWQAVGKKSLWNDWECPKCKSQYNKQGQIVCPDCKHQGGIEVWRAYMHHMIDALAEGKTIEDYIKTL